jgi:hypothetical protein
MQTLDRILGDWCVSKQASLQTVPKHKQNPRHSSIGVRGEDDLARVIRDDIQLADV